MVELFLFSLSVLNFVNLLQLYVLFNILPCYEWIVIVFLQYFKLQYTNVLQIKSTLLQEVCDQEMSDVAYKPLLERF